MKKIFLVVSIHLIVFICLFPNATLLADFETITQEDKYYETLHKLFSEAEASIDIIINSIVMAPLDPNSPINKLIDILIEARRKGVRVRVIFEDSRSPENFIAYRNLLENGIDVFFDTSKALINSKTIVIDSHICVIGGLKWSPDSRGRNYALSVIIDSPEMAKVVEDSISKLTLTEGLPFVETTPKGVLIPDDFLFLKDFGIRFIVERTNRPFDLYFALIKEAQENSSNEFLLDYQKYGRLLGLGKKFFRAFKDEREKKEHYYARIKKILKVLEKRYHLVKYDEVNNKVALLKQFDIDLSKPDKKDHYFVIPYKFWDAKFPYRLSLNAKYLYLISLCEAERSARYPYWFGNEYMLSDLYRLDFHTISNGLEELEEENLIEVARAPHIRGESKKKARNIYHINKIITEEEFDREIEDFRLKYGKDITDQAQQQAAALNESKDPVVIETFIHLIQKYGYNAVRRANVNTLRYKRSSNLRHISSTMKLLEKE